MVVMAMLQVGKRVYYYCETCGENYADNLDDYEPEDFVTLLSDNRVSLKFVPQEGDSSVPNETTLHDDGDEDVTSLPDVDASQEFIPLSSPLTSVHPSVTSDVEDDNISSGDHHTASSSQPNHSSSSLIGPSQISTSQLASSQDGDVVMKDTCSSEENGVCMCNVVESDASLQEPSKVVSPSHPIAPDVSLDQDDCSDTAALQEVTTVRAQPNLPTVNVEGSNAPSTSHTPTVTTASVPPSDSVATQSIAGSNTLLLSSSSSIVLPDVTTPSNITAENGDCRHTPARSAKLNRAPYTDKDENKVTSNVLVHYITCYQSL